MSNLGRVLAAAALAAALIAGSTGCSSGSGAASTASGTSPVAPAGAPSSSATATSTPTGTPTATGTPTPAPTKKPKKFNKKAHSLKDPNSIWVVVNKLRPLHPKSWAPKDLINVPVAHDNPAVMRKSAGDALVTMFAAAKKKGGGAMQVQSSYRSYSVQVSVYNGWVKSLGKKQADRQSARPGYSEHQTGLAVDISPVPLKCALAACFGSTTQGKWLAKNAWKYGFLLRYPADKTKITGYEYEPWHFRYIGKSLAKELHKENVQTLEEFFGLPAAPDYKN